MSDLLINAPIEYEPLRKNRFLFRFTSDLGIQEWWIQDGKRPKITNTTQEIPFLNTSSWVVGRYKWDSITVTLRDPIGPSASQAIMEWMRLASESCTGRQGYAAAYARDVVIEMLDPTGVAVSQWICVKCIPTDADFGNLSYSDDALATISLTLQPYYCILSF